MAPDQHVVVIGGGFGGVSVAKELAAKLNPATHTLTLINPHSFFVDLPALIRASTTSEGDLEDLVLMPYADFMVAPKPHPSGTEKFKGTVKLGKAVSFTSAEGGKGGGEVLLEGGEKVPYSVLVIATGNTWSGPLNLPDGDFSAAKTYLNEWRAKFKAAKSVVIVGGGAVGIEYSGEIRDFFPETKVTLVHAQDQLLNSAYPDKYRRAALARVQKGGVEVVLNDRVVTTEPSAEGTITTASGKVIKADLVIPTWGGSPNTTLVSASLGVDVLSKTGHVQVQPTLQINGHPRVFAVGDIIEWKEQKQAVKAGAHAAIVAANIVTLTSGTANAPALKEYKGSPELILVTFGRTGGVAYMGFLWGLVFGDWLAAMLKSKSLMIEMTRGQFKLGNYRTAGASA